MITVTRIRKTCTACPAQWEGTLSDGQCIYVRYRWGHLSIRVGATVDDAVSSNVEIFGWNSPDNWADGWLEYDELKALTAGKFVWPDKEDNDNQT